MGNILIPILTILTRQSEDFFKLTFVFFYLFYNSTTYPLTNFCV